MKPHDYLLHASKTSCEVRSGITHLAMAGSISHETAGELSRLCLQIEQSIDQAGKAVVDIAREAANMFVDLPGLVAHNVVSITDGPPGRRGIDSGWHDFDGLSS